MRSHTARMLSKEQIEALDNDDLIKWYRSLRRMKNDMATHRRQYEDFDMGLSEKEQLKLNTFTWNWHEARRQLMGRGLRKYENP